MKICKFVRGNYCNGVKSKKNDLGDKKGRTDLPGESKKGQHGHLSFHIFFCKNQ